MESRQPTKIKPPMHTRKPGLRSVIRHSLGNALDHLLAWRKPQPAAPAPVIRMADIAGLEEAKNELREALGGMCSPQFESLPGMIRQGGILLAGEPGTGKTSLALALANEAGLPFWQLSVARLAAGISAQAKPALSLNRAFGQARSAARLWRPAILFLDDMDLPDLPEMRAVHHQLITLLLAEIDLLQESQPVFLLAAARRPGRLDPALLRPGRLDRQISIQLPDRAARTSILSIHTRPLRLAIDVSLGIIARTTTGFSGGDLAYLCRQAAITASHKHNEQVSMADFEEAIDRFLLMSARNLILNDQDRRMAAYHEAGHALAAWSIPIADPVQQITLIPNCRVGDRPSPERDTESSCYSRETLLARLAVLLAGRAAEDVAMHDFTSASEGDLREATWLANCMVTRWGMSRLGPVALETHPGSSAFPFSEQTSARIDQEVQALLSGQYERVSKLLSNARAELDQLTSALLDEESLGYEEIMRILGPRPVNIARQFDEV